MKKMLALGGVLSAPLMVLAIPQIPNLVLVLVSVGFGGLAFNVAVFLGVAVVLGVFFGDGNLLGALLALA